VYAFRAPVPQLPQLLRTRLTAIACGARLPTRLRLFQHKKLPCCRDRAAERRKELAATFERSGDAASGELTVRTLADQVASLKAELAAKKALEIAERNRALGGGAGSPREIGSAVTMSPLTEARAKAAAAAAVSVSEASTPAARQSFAPAATAAAGKW